jgi:hypothetical protein
LFLIAKFIAHFVNYYQNSLLIRHRSNLRKQNKIIHISREAAKETIYYIINNTEPGIEEEQNYPKNRRSQKN